jgi:uncharacterized protein YciI
MRFPVLVLLLGSAGSGLAQRTFDVTIADSTYHMKQYWFVLYTKGDGPPMDSLTAATLQKEHLAHQGAQAARGLIVMAGPFGSNDEGWRGSLLYDCETREEVEAQLVIDPFVKSGRLTYTIVPWWGAVGTKLP